ncbi:MAG TPA: hypothetical protein EYP60_00010 [bacterium (Candidatus Stahlbacteria)]|nr:hypothetical protein [Candidatus Stahlbacteria bacterium]
MNRRRIISLFIIELLILAVMMLSGCDDETSEITKEETTEITSPSTDRETLKSLIIEHEELFKKTKEDYDKGKRPGVTKDEQGNIVTRWNYLPNGALDTVQKKREDEHGWTTTAYRFGRPLITAYGKVDGDTLRNAYDEITGGSYDFTENQVDVAFIRLYVDQVKEINISTLQGMLANPTISDDDLAPLLGKANNPGFGGHPAMVIGYTNTANPNDGNRVYASIIWKYFLGLPQKVYYFDEPK